MTNGLLRYVGWTDIGVIKCSRAVITEPQRYFAFFKIEDSALLYGPRGFRLIKQIYFKVQIEESEETVVSCCNHEGTAVVIGRFKSTFRNWTV